MFALSRPEKGGEPPGRFDFLCWAGRERVGSPPVTAPAWTSPKSESLPSVPTPKLLSWAFQCAWLKPRLYDQSCSRLCIANRFVTDAAMSLPTPGTRFACEHFVSNQAFVNGY